MKYYYIEVKLGNKWTLVHVETRHKDALNYVRLNPPVKYAIRIVRVERTIVFHDGDK